MTFGSGVEHKTQVLQDDLWGFPRLSCHQQCGFQCGSSGNWNVNLRGTIADLVENDSEFFFNYERCPDISGEGGVCRLFTGLISSFAKSC